MAVPAPFSESSSVDGRGASEFRARERDTIAGDLVEVTMRQSIVILLVAPCVAFGQTKKTVVVGLDQPGQVDVFRDNGFAALKTASPNARIVGVGREGFLREIADADGLIAGGLTRHQFRAARQTFHSCRSSAAW